MRSVEPGDPRNDQMLAQTRDAMRDLLDITVHPLIDQAEAQDADLSLMMAVLCSSWMDHEEYMPHECLVSVLALALFQIAKTEREVVSDGKTMRKGE
jgi:hypothetical protein